MKPDCGIRRSQLPRSPGAPELVSSVFSAPRSHPPEACWAPQGGVTRLPHSPTPLNNSAPTIQAHNFFVCVGGPETNAFHIENQICCLLIGRLWRTLPGEMPEGGASREGTPTVWCAFPSLLCAKGKTAEGADFSSLNWHSRRRCTQTHERAHTLYGNRESQGVLGSHAWKAQSFVCLLNVWEAGENQGEKKKKRGQKGLLLFSWQQRTQTHTRHVSQSEGLMFGVINTVPVIFISCHLVHYTQTWPPRLYS